MRLMYLGRSGTKNRAMVLLACAPAIGALRTWLLSERDEAKRCIQASGSCWIMLVTFMARHLIIGCACACAVLHGGADG